MPVKSERIYRELKKRLARNVARERHAQGLTCEELGRRSGLHWRHIQKVEAGDANITLLTIARLAQGLDVDVGGLVSSCPDPISRPRKDRTR